MRLLITRPEPDASALAQELEGLGHAPLVAPLMDIVSRPFALAFTGVQGVLFTSANGVRAFADQVGTPPDGLAAYVVGPASADAARVAGWRHVQVAGGDVHALAGLVSKTVDPAGGRLVHLSGKAAAGDLAGLLTEQGYDVERIVAYEARAAARLPELAGEALRGGTVEGVLLFSPRTARLYGTLVGEAGLEAAASRVTAYCLSQAVADALTALPGVPKKVASAPQTPQLLALLSA
jgi:uroporphyrinogen-III synthase